MTETTHGPRPDPDLALIKSTLFSNTLNIPMPLGVLPPKSDENRLIEQGGDELRAAIRAEEAGDMRAANDRRRDARRSFRRALDGYRQRQDRKGQALSEFCLAHVALLEGDLENARHLSKQAAEFLFELSASNAMGSK